MEFHPDVVALSSGEAEYYGIVKGASQGFGVRGMMDDLGIKLSVTLNTDATAALGIALRKGLGKVRHIEVNQLWVQDKVAAGELVIHKVGTCENLADILTKYVDQRLLDRHSVRMSAHADEGRHALAPEVAG